MQPELNCDWLLLHVRLTFSRRKGGAALAAKKKTKQLDYVVWEGWVSTDCGVTAAAVPLSSGLEPFGMEASAAGTRIRHIMAPGTG